MAAIATINLKDAQATPVTHAFAYASMANERGSGRVVYEDRALGIYIGYNKLTLGVDRPSGNAKQATRNLRLMIKLETPKLEVVSNSTVSGIPAAPTVSYRPVAELMVTCPERSQLQDRQDLRKFLLEALASAPVVDMFEKFELPY